MDVTKEVQAIIDEGEKRGLYDTSKLGPELVAFFHDRAGMLAGLRDEMSEGYREWLDDCVGALHTARDQFAALTTAQSEAAELRFELGVVQKVARKWEQYGEQKAAEIERLRARVAELEAALNERAGV